MRALAGIPGDPDSNSVLQQVQWAALGMIVPVFFIGGVVVHRVRDNIFWLLDRLYGECEMQRALLEAQSHANSVSGKRIPEDKVEMILPEPTALKVAKRSPYEKFYDTRWENKRAFMSSLHANTTARCLLYKREEDKKRFLTYVMKRGIEEHSYSETLMILHIKLLRFVFNAASEASVQEKQMLMSSKRLDYDNRCQTLNPRP